MRIFWLEWALSREDGEGKGGLSRPQGTRNILEAKLMDVQVIITSRVNVVEVGAPVCILGFWLGKLGDGGAGHQVGEAQKRRRLWGQRKSLVWALLGLRYAWNVPGRGWAAVASQLRRKSWLEQQSCRPTGGD